jgi:hypothetical protein
MLGTKKLRSLVCKRSVFAAVTVVAFLSLSLAQVPFNTCTLQLCKFTETGVHAATKKRVSIKERVFFNHLAAINIESESCRQLKT